MNIEQNVKNFISTHCIKKSSYLVAVSGGSDSMALLSVLVKLDYNVCVAHCNFKLRGDESDKDEELVVNYCKSMNIPYFVKSFDTIAFCQQNKIGIQEGARKLRYTWFDELCKEHSISYILTAHHLNDDVETFLFNLVRADGVNLLKGILSRRGNILRPLLRNTKEEILTYCNNYNVPFRTDSSNNNDKYSRNLIRNRVIPNLTTLNNQALNHIQNTINEIALLKELSKEYFTSIKNKYIKKPDNKVIIDLYLLKANERFSLPFIENYLINFNFNRTQIEEIYACETTGKIWKSKTHTISYNRGALILALNTSLISKSQFLSIDKIEQNCEVVFDNQFIKFNLISISPTSFSENYFYLDFDKVIFPISLRHWKNGDRFSPLGLKGTKKISDYLVDKKVDLIHKDSAIVVEDQSGICALLPFVISDSFKITQSTKKILRVELKRT